jgi:hypothetical protein
MGTTPLNLWVVSEYTAVCPGQRVLGTPNRPCDLPTEECSQNEALRHLKAPPRRLTCFYRLTKDDRPMPSSLAIPTLTRISDPWSCSIESIGSSGRSGRFPT